MCDAPQSDAAIRKSLEELPSGLVETYSRIMERLEKRRRKFLPTTERVFKWIICARRPLSLEELKEAIAFEPGDKSWEASKIVTDPSGQSIVQACGHLITIDDDDDTVRLVHRTVQQYFIEGDDCPPHRFQFQRRNAEHYLGEVCVTYLSFSDFETQITRRNPRSEFVHKDILTNRISHFPQSTGLSAKVIDMSCRMRARNTRRKTPDIKFTELSRIVESEVPEFGAGSKYRMLDYAVENWVWHTICFTEENTKLWPKLGHLAMDHSLNFRRWGARARRRDLPYMPLFSWTITAGHATLLRLLLDRGVDIEVKDKNGQTPLHRAAEVGNEAVVRLLLDKNAKTEEKDHWRRTALHWAAIEGHEPVARLLIDHWASTDTDDGAGMMALQLAAQKGHLNVVRLLFDKGVDVESKDSSGRTALLMGATEGHEAITRLALDRGADIETPLKFTEQRALYIAAKCGHASIVELLLERGANITAKTQHGETAYDAAAKSGFSNIANTLRATMSLRLGQQSRELVQQRRELEQQRLGLEQMSKKLVQLSHKLTQEMPNINQPNEELDSKSWDLSRRVVGRNSISVQEALNIEQQSKEQKQKDYGQRMQDPKLGQRNYERKMQDYERKMQDDERKMQDWERKQQNYEQDQQYYKLMLHPDTTVSDES